MIKHTYRNIKIYSTQQTQIHNVWNPKIIKKQENMTHIGGEKS
jgi:hypothetical protein